jgi:integrase
MAKRTANNLKHKEVLADIARLRAANKAATFGDGGGLALILTPAGRARFVHKFQWQGRTVERWLPGEFPETIKLAEARALRDADREQLRAGVNPLAAAKAAVVAAAGVPSFADYARTNAAFLAPDSANAKASWLRQMTGERTAGVTVGALAAMPIDSIGQDDVKAVIAPIWFAKPATAKELCGRIRRVLEHRQVNARPDDERRNPADFERITQAIGKKLELDSTPRAALPWEDVPAFLAQLATRPQMSARALEMIVATGCRVNEITGSRWQEVDWKARTLTIPASRMKTGEKHVVPLSLAMVRVLRAVAPPQGARPTDLIFPNGKGKPYATKDVLVHVKALAGAAPTTHGFRSALSDWGLAMPHRGHQFSPDLMDKVIAHKVANRVRRAYQRDTWLERRRIVMREWSRFCAGSASATVLAFRLAA